MVMRAAITDLESKAVGSAQQNISKGIVEQTSLILPPDNLIEAFDLKVTPLFESWISSLRESSALSHPASCQ